MGDESPKNWWHTIPGFMTGVAALITAVGGVIVLVRQSNQTQHPEQVPDATITKEIVPTEPRPTPPQSPSGSTTTLTQKPPAEAGTRAIVLPAKREYVLGTPFDKARYVLMSAVLYPHTSESKTFVLRIHFISEGLRGYHAEFCSCQFLLLTDTQSIPPHDYFIDQVPIDESRDQNLSFPIDKPVTYATLRIQVGISGAEIPLDFSSTDHAQ
jgi:hypothetical protein